MFVLPPPPFVPTRAEHVWAYWFAGRRLAGAPPLVAPRWDPVLWFAAPPPLRRELADHFAGLGQRAGAGELDGWADTPRGALSLVLLTHAMPRVMFAGTALASAHADRARLVAARTVAAGLAGRLAAVENFFLLAPLLTRRASDSSPPNPGSRASWRARG